MTDHQSLASRLTSLLQLDMPPVAMAQADEAPPGVQASTETVPSSCAFWRSAEQGVFYASAEQHYNCPVGAMVMGFELPQAVSEELGQLVESMCNQNYLAPEEAAHIPGMQRAASGIVYGPLADMPVEPDVVLMWLSPRQAMVLNETDDGANWASDSTRVGGRPGCAALPLALADGRPTLSFGCIGMRTFTQIASDRMLAAVPGERLADVVAALEETASANEAMQQFYEQRRAEVMT